MKLCVIDPSCSISSYLAILNYTLTRAIFLVEDNKTASNPTHRQANPLLLSAY
jgi:hypothetical protein